MPLSSFQGMQVISDPNLVIADGEDWSGVLRLALDAAASAAFRNASALVISRTRKFIEWGTG